MKIKIAICALGLLALNNSVDAAPTKMDQLNTLNQNIASVQLDLQKSTQKKSQLQNALEKTETTESEINQHVKQVQKKLTQQQKKLQVLLQQSIPLQQQKSQNHTLLKQQIRTAYLISHQPYLKLLLAPNDVMQTQQMLTYFHYIAQSQLTTMQQLQQSISACERNQAHIQKQTTQLLSLKKIQLQNQQALQKSQVQRQQLLENINQQIKTKHDKLVQLLANKNSLQKTIQSLSSSSISRNAVFISNRAFDKLKGKLPWPVLGHIRRSFGTPIAESELKWDGTLIAGNLGDPVRAVASGRVIFAKWLAGYGLLLILSHNNGYMTLYGRNQTLYANVGDIVKAGEVIAAVGKSGGFTNPALYFSIRHNAQALNPAHWCH